MAVIGPPDRQPERPGLGVSGTAALGVSRERRGRPLRASCLLQISIDRDFSDGRHSHHSHCGEKASLKTRAGARFIRSTLSCHKTSRTSDSDKTAGGENGRRPTTVRATENLFTARCERNVVEGDCEVDGPLSQVGRHVPDQRDGPPWRLEPA